MPTDAELRRRAWLARLIRELLVLGAIAGVPVVAIVSAQQVAKVEPLVAAFISGLGVVLPLVGTILLAAYKSGEVGFLTRVAAPVSAFASRVCENWTRTLSVFGIAFVVSFFFWWIGMGSLKDYPFSCFGSTTINWTVFKQSRFSTCTEAQTVTVWVRPFRNPMQHDFQCSGSGISLPAYKPTRAGEQWVCPTNRCPSDMAYIPGGFSKLAGSIRSFCLDRTLTSVGDFVACQRCAVGEEGLTSTWPGAPPADAKRASQHCTRARFRSCRSMNCVDFESAESYCDSKHRRLPSTTQWYWEVRGRDAPGAPFTHPWRTNELNPDLICHQDAWPCAVGSHPMGASLHGVFDLLGNVWEWTITTASDGRAVVVGGGFNGADFPEVNEVNFPEENLETTKQTLQGSFWAEPSIRSVNLGFRCESDPLEPRQNKE